MQQRQCSTECDNSDMGLCAGACMQEQMSEGPQLLPGLNPSVLVRLSERPELLNPLLAHAAGGNPEGLGDEQGRSEVACRMA